MKPVSPDDKLSANAAALSASGEAPHEDVPADPVRRASGASSEKGRSLSGSACADRTGEAADPDGEALLHVLRSGKPLAPEDVPDIFSPEEQAARQRALRSGVPGDVLGSQQPSLSPSGSAPAGVGTGGTPAEASDARTGCAMAHAENPKACDEPVGEVNGRGAASGFGTSASAGRVSASVGRVGASAGREGASAGWVGASAGSSTFSSGDARSALYAEGGGHPGGAEEQARPSHGAGSGFAGAPRNPRWGGSGGTGVVFASGGGPGTPPGGAGGAWVWLPEGMKPPKPWRKRHPIVFWGGCLLLLLVVFNWGRMSVQDGPLAGPRIAVINLEGLILDSSSIVSWIEKIRADRSFQGAVLRINSPGGAVGPSQEIYAAIKRLDATKPVVASMGALAASGGYYAALGAREIYASPSSITASIGVKMQVPNFGTLLNTLGISEKTLTTGNLKDAGSTWRSMTPDEEAYFRSLIGDMYEEFIETVAEERELPLDKVRSLADGRAMTGRQALEAHLVDRLGDHYEATRRVMSLCNLPDSPLPKLVEGPEKPGSMWKELIGGVLDIGLEQKSKAEQPVFMY